MENLETVIYNINGEDIEYVIIRHSENAYTSVLKSEYEEQQAKAAELGGTL